MENSAISQSGQDHKGAGQETQPEPNHDLGVTRIGAIGQSGLEPLIPSPQEQDDSNTFSKPCPSVSACKLSPVERAPSLTWLKQFVVECSGKYYSFTRTEYADAANGGGHPRGIDIAVEDLDGFRLARRSAEKAGTGKPVMVHYVDIPFERMTTADVMEAIIRPVCREQHMSYAEAAITRDAVSDPTYFVSPFLPCVVEAVLILCFAAVYSRLHTHGTACS